MWLHVEKFSTLNMYLPPLLSPSLPPLFPLTSHTCSPPSTLPLPPLLPLTSHTCSPLNSPSLPPSSPSPLTIDLLSQFSLFLPSSSSPLTLALLTQFSLSLPSSPHLSHLLSSLSSPIILSNSLTNVLRWPLLPLFLMSVSTSGDTASSRRRASSLGRKLIMTGATQLGKL